jgi:8-oxo-dGTP diphosphatase
MEKTKFIVNVEGCLINKDKILMILRGDSESHAPNTISFPGGQVDSKDADYATFEDTLRREIYEEVGLKVVEPFEYLENKKFITSKGNSVIDIVMFCKIVNPTEVKIDTHEVKDYMWMSTDEILKDVRSPQWIKQSIMLIRQKINI